MRSEPASWSRQAVGELAVNLDRHRIPLPSAQRAIRSGSYPYWGANGPIDFIDDFLFEGPHVLVAEDGNTVVRPDGRATVHWADGRFWVNNHAHVLKGAPRVNQRWLYFALSLVEIRPFITGSAQPKLNQRNLNVVSLPTPPEKEQDGIAFVLGALDDKIDSNRRLASLLEQTAAELFRARFVDFVGVEEFEDSGIGRIPRDWRCGPLSDLTKLRYGKSLPAAVRVPGPIAVVGSSGIIGAHNSRLIRGPVVVVGRKGTAGSVVWVGRDAWPIDTTFFAEPVDGIDPVFVYFALLHANLPHLTADSAVPGLNREAAEQRLISLPPPHEIEDFAQTCRALFAKKDASEAEQVALAAIRDALLPKLISGVIRVPDTTDSAEVIEPAREALLATPP